jgi:hypothetical protein
MFSSLLSVAAVLCFAGGLVLGQRVGPMPIDGSGHTPLNTAYSSAPVDNRAGGQFRGAFYYPLDPSGNTVSVEPNPRLISNMVMGASSLSPINEHAVSALTVAFGQFIAHGEYLRCYIGKGGYGVSNTCLVTRVSFFPF